MIVSLEEFTRIRPTLTSVVATSGGFDPLHPGHLDCIRASQQYGTTLVVIVNGDGFLAAKKGKSFMDLTTRCKIIDDLKGVDYVIPYEVSADMTVRGALSAIVPDVFTKGGDRFDAKTIPEWETCLDLGITIVTGVGGGKTYSSSDLLKNWHG